MDIVRIAWAAGIFEGEGSIYVATKGKYKYPRLQVKMSDEDIVIRFRNAVECGKIYEHKGKKPSYYKTQHYWQLTNLDEVKKVISLFWEFLGPRRRRKAEELGIAPMVELVDTSALRADSFRGV